MKKYSFRIWDPEDQFHEGLIKKYRYWTFEVSYRQHTLGSFLIILNRHAEKISDLTSRELISLGRVMKKAENIINKTFKPDKYNYLQLGNGIGHLHFHGIPRYATKREFEGLKYIDKKFGLPPIWSYKNVSHELVAKIRDVLLSNCSR